MIIRDARPGDAQTMSRVLIASITELCTADHRDDREVLGRWLANKAPETVSRWLETPGHLFVAEEGSEILAVGGFNDGGEITLNYVAPAARFRGITKAMLAHLEEAMRHRGIREAYLSSTETAHRLYLSAGWVDRSDPGEKFGIMNYPMTKTLA